MAEVRVLGKKNNSVGTIIGIIFLLFFLGPVISMFASFASVPGGMFMIVPGIIFFIVFIGVIVVIVNVAKSAQKGIFGELMANADKPSSLINIPVDFFEQGKPVKGLNSDPLFQDLYGRKIIYYENGKPVFEHK